jgi:hypothetical protein
VVNKLISGIDQAEHSELVAKASYEVAHQNDEDDDGSENDEKSAARNATIKSKLNSIQGSCLYQVSLPDGLEQKTYGALFQYLAARGSIPLGLLRGTFANMNMGPKANRMPYVFTNPSKETELFSCDRVFILSTTPQRSNTKMDMKDWLLDIQMQKSREKAEAATTEGAPVIAMVRSTHPSKGIESLEKGQRKLDDRINKLSTNIDKKLASLLAAVDKLVKDRNQIDDARAVSPTFALDLTTPEGRSRVMSAESVEEDGSVASNSNETAGSSSVKHANKQTQDHFDTKPPFTLDKKLCPREYQNPVGKSQDSDDDHSCAVPPISAPIELQLTDNKPPFPKKVALKSDTSALLEKDLVENISKSADDGRFARVEDDDPLLLKPLSKPQPSPKVGSRKILMDMGGTTVHGNNFHSPISSSAITGPSLAHLAVQGLDRAAKIRAARESAKANGEERPVSAHAVAVSQRNRSSTVDEGVHKRERTLSSIQ